MIGIFLENGELDVYQQDIETSWVAARFASGIRDAYTNDITIPKTHNNVELLGASGLLDSPNQLYGSRLSPASLSINGEPMDVYIQVVEVTDDEITICCFERTDIENWLSKKFREIVTDDYASTIYDWNEQSHTRFPTVFKRYNYGTWFAPHFAQLHGSQTVRAIMQKIQQRLHVPMPINDFEEGFNIISTRKTVCPWNHTQMWEGIIDDEWNYVNWKGGQHITNDLKWVSDESTADQIEIKFNRDCSVYMKAWFSFLKKADVTQPVAITLHRNGAWIKNFWLNMPTDPEVSKVQYFTEAFNFHAGDVISMQNHNHPSSLSRLAVTLELSITNYSVSDSDYDTQLDYVPRNARIPLYYTLPDGIHYDWAYFDNTQYQWLITYGNIIGYSVITLPYKSLSYFGLWCNMPDVSVADFLFSYAFAREKKVDFIGGELKLLPANQTIDTELNGNITSIRFESDKFGQNNYIKLAGDTTGDQISHIDNIWLDYNHTIFTSFLARVYPWQESPFGDIGRIYQYYPEINDSGEVEDGYKDIDGVVMMSMDFVGGTYILRAITDNTNMNFEEITSITEVDFTTNDPRVRNKDFIYFQGRKYMVEEGSINNNTGESKLKMLLVPSV